MHVVYELNGRLAEAESKVTLMNGRKFTEHDGKVNVPCASWEAPPPRSTPGSVCRGRRCPSTAPWAEHRPKHNAT